jgi:signal peptidase I
LKAIEYVKRNEILKTIIVLVALFLVVQGGWYSFKIVMHTDVPMAYVPSGSMEPNLRVGDLVVIQGIDPHAITEGMIIVFYVPGHYGEDNYRIVHRVIKVVQVDSQLAYETKGDNNPVSDYYRWQYIPADHVVGKVVARIPYLGLVAMKMREPLGIILIVLLVLALFAIEFTDGKHKKQKTSESPNSDSGKSTALTTFLVVELFEMNVLNAFI